VDTYVQHKDVQHEMCQRVAGIERVFAEYVSRSKRIEVDGSGVALHTSPAHVAQSYFGSHGSMVDAASHTSRAHDLESAYDLQRSVIGIGGLLSHTSQVHTVHGAGDTQSSGHDAPGLPSHTSQAHSVQNDGLLKSSGVGIVRIDHIVGRAVR